MKDWTRMKMTIKDFYISNLRKQVNNAKESLKGNFMKENHESGFKYVEFSATGETAKRKWRVDQHEKEQWKITATISATEKSIITVVVFLFNTASLPSIWNTEQCIFSVNISVESLGLHNLQGHWVKPPSTAFFIHSVSCTQQKFPYSSKTLLTRKL